jgi:hypothetical protein
MSSRSAIGTSPPQLALINGLHFRPHLVFQKPRVPKGSSSAHQSQSASNLLIGAVWDPACQPKARRLPHRGPHGFPLAMRSQVELMLQSSRSSILEASRKRDGESNRESRFVISEGELSSPTDCGTFKVSDIAEILRTAGAGDKLGREPARPRHEH